MSTFVCIFELVSPSKKEYFPGDVIGTMEYLNLPTMLRTRFKRVEEKEEEPPYIPTPVVDDTFTPYRDTSDTNDTYISNTTDDSPDIEYGGGESGGAGASGDFDSSSNDNN